MWALSQDCSSNAGGDFAICYTESSFTLVGSDPTGNPVLVGGNPILQWTALSSGFNITNSTSLTTTVTPSSGSDFSALQGGFYDFQLCVDCNIGRHRYGSSESESSSGYFD